jgi:flagellar biosynthetic protein FliR
VSAADVHVLLDAIGTTHIAGFFLVLARVAPLFVLAPLFSSGVIPAQVRTIIGIGITVGLTPVAVHGQHIPGQPLALGLLFVEQMLVGLAYSLTLATLFAAITSAGQLVDAVSGFSFGSLVDPITGNPGGVMGQTYILVGTAIFIAIGGDAWVLKGLAQTFTLVPLSAAPRLNSLVGGAETACMGILTSALEVAAPVFLALIITDIGFGMVARVVPQLNIFSVGFPMKIGVTLIVVIASLPFLGGWMSNELTTSVGTALHSLGIA